MHPNKPFDYDSEINYEHTYLAIHHWGTPSVVTIGEHHMHAHRHSCEVADEILRRNIIKDWLDEWVSSDGAAKRRDDIMNLRSRTSLPKDLTKIPSAPVHSSCRMDSKMTMTSNSKQKSSHYQRRKALEKEVKWRNDMTMMMIES
mmetsp:Transcript_586/g.789  ORF Transcript_586/g.789 Transcript_586/m.789 type:complete len:145 (-) Transcript_586:100-534(-)